MKEHLCAVLSRPVARATHIYVKRVATSPRAAAAPCVASMQFESCRTARSETKPDFDLLCASLPRDYIPRLPPRKIAHRRAERRRMINRARVAGFYFCFFKARSNASDFNAVDARFRAGTLHRANRSSRKRRAN